MLPRSDSRIELVQSLALGFEVCLRVQVRRVKMRVTHPTADDGNVHACRDQVNGRGMPTTGFERSDLCQSLQHRRPNPGGFGFVPASGSAGIASPGCRLSVALPPVAAVAQP